jgi:hypothetical protein
MKKSNLTKIDLKEEQQKSYENESFLFSANNKINRNIRSGFFIILTMIFSLDRFVL